MFRISYFWDLVSKEKWQKHILWLSKKVVIFGEKLISSSFCFWCFLYNKLCKRKVREFKKKIVRALVPIASCKPSMVSLPWLSRVGMRKPCSKTNYFFLQILKNITIFYYFVYIQNTHYTTSLLFRSYGDFCLLCYAKLKNFTLCNTMNIKHL